VELAVVLVIGVVLVGLALTVLPRLREKGNRTQCADNLREIGEAVILFRDRHRPPFLPAARIADGYATWMVQILPYLPRPRGAAAPDWDESRPYYQQPDDVRRFQLSLYYCPARRAPVEVSKSGDVPPPGFAAEKNYPGALSDYGCAAGDGDPRHPWTSARANGAIILGEVLRRGPGHTILAWRGYTDFDLRGGGDGKVTVEVRKGRGPPGSLAAKLRRGTSHTILIGEKHLRPGEFGRAEAGDGSIYNGGRPANFSRVGGPGHGLARSMDDKLDLQFPIFGSWHAGGLVNFLMADGSVRGIRPDVAPALLGQLIVRDDD
jgi:prepilin-type processing-associated H-X9-DG protein